MNYIIDTSAKQITMLDARFYRDETGVFVPSVTTILDAFPKDASYYAWLKNNGQDSDNIRDRAAERGTAVHNLTEAYDRGEEVSLLSADGRLAFKMSEWAMLERYIDFCTRFKPEVMQCEQNYVSPELGWAGTVDRIIRMNGKTYLIDIKTSNAIYQTYWLQLAAYRRLVEAVGGISVDGVGILWLNAKTRTEGSKGAVQGIGWQLVTQDDTTKELNLFGITRQLWLAQHANDLPKNSSYSITHKK